MQQRTRTGERKGFPSGQSVGHCKPRMKISSAVMKLAGMALDMQEFYIFAHCSPCVEENGYFCNSRNGTESPMKELYAEQAITEDGDLS